MHLSRFCYITPLSDQVFLLMNTYSDKIFFVSKPVYAFLHSLQNRKNISHSLSSNELDLLRIEGFVYSNASEEEEKYQKYVEKFEKSIRKTKTDIFISINPTQGCNLACKYCYFDYTKKNSYEVMEKHDIDLIFKSLKKIQKRFKRKSAHKISLFGGEPLLGTNKEVIEYILALSEKNGYEIDAVTNGTNLHTYLPLVKKYANLFTNFQITLDGPKEIHDQRRKRQNSDGTFDLIASNIGQLIELKIPLTIRINLDRSNINHLPNLIKYFIKRGWTKHDFVEYDPAFVLDNERIDKKSLFTTRYELTLELLAVREIMQNDFPDVNKVLTDDNIISPMFLPLVEYWRNPDKPRHHLSFQPHYCSVVGTNFITFAADGNIYACWSAVGEKKMCLGSYKPEFAINEDVWKTIDNLYPYNVPKCRKCFIQRYCAGACIHESVRQNNDIYNPPEKLCEMYRKDFAFYLNLYKDELIKHAFSRNQKNIVKK